MARLKLNANVIDKISTAIAAGNYAKVAATYAGIDESTYYIWLQKAEKEMKQYEAMTDIEKELYEESVYVELFKSIKKAEAEAEVRDVHNIEKAAKKTWQASAWRLERMHPDRWGLTRDRKAEDTGGELADLVKSKMERRRQMKQGGGDSE